MCDCVDPPKGLKPTPPTEENAAAYHAAYGDMVKVQYVSQFAPVSATVFYGPATRTNYGYRAKGDVFYVWEADVIGSDGVFERVENFQVEAASQTVVPPPPIDDSHFVDDEIEHIPFASELSELDPSLADTEPAEPVTEADAPAPKPEQKPASKPQRPASRPAKPKVKRK